MSPGSPTVHIPSSLSVVAAASQLSPSDSLSVQVPPADYSPVSPVSPAGEPLSQPLGEGGHMRHQRMESEDRVRLEQALQSLEEHIISGAHGVDNMAASFDDVDEDTHL